MRKGISPMMSLILIVAVSMASIALVLRVGSPLLEKTEEFSSFSEAKNSMHRINSAVKEVSYEGNGSSRKIGITVGKGEYKVSSADNSVIYEMESEHELFSKGMWKREGDIVISTGADVRAYEADVTGDGKKELVLENSRVLFAVNKTGNITSPESLDTGKLIKKLWIKDSGFNVTPNGSQVSILDMENSSSGTGYTELLDSGSHLGMGRIKVSLTLDSGFNYSITYVLSAKSDFVKADISLNEQAYSVIYNPIDSESDFETLVNATVEDGNLVLDWWNYSWGKRREINITNGQNSNLTNYTVDLPLDFGNSAENCSREIRVTDSLGNEMPSQVFGEVYQEKCQEARVLFEVSIENGSTETYYVYYNNSYAQYPGYPEDSPGLAAGSGYFQITGDYYVEYTGGGTSADVGYPLSQATDILSVTNGQDVPPKTSNILYNNNPTGKDNYTMGQSTYSYEVTDEGPLATVIKSNWSGVIEGDSVSDTRYFIFFDDKPYYKVRDEFDTDSPSVNVSWYMLVDWPSNGYHCIAFENTTHLITNVCGASQAGLPSGYSRDYLKSELGGYWYAVKEDMNSDNTFAVMFPNTSQMSSFNKIRMLDENWNGFRISEWWHFTDISGLNLTYYVYLFRNSSYGEVSRDAYREQGIGNPPDYSIGEEETHWPGYAVSGTFSTQNIAKATLWASDTGQGIRYYLSANNGTDWEEVNKSEEHVFTNPGKNLKVRIELNGSHNPLVESYTVNCSHVLYHATHGLDFALSGNSFANQSDRWVCTEDSDNNLFVAWVFAGQEPLYSNYSRDGNSYNASITSLYDVLLAFSMEGCSNVEGKENSIASGDFWDMIFPAFSYEAISYVINIILNFDKIDIVNDERWAGGYYDLFIKNEGYSGEKTKVSVATT